MELPLNRVYLISHRDILSLYMTKKLNTLYARRTNASEIVTLILTLASI